VSPYVGQRIVIACWSAWRCQEKGLAMGNLARNRKTAGGAKLFWLWRKGMSLLSKRLALCPPTSLIRCTPLFTLCKKAPIYPMLKHYKKFGHPPASRRATSTLQPAISPRVTLSATEVTPSLSHSTAGRGLSPRQSQRLPFQLNVSFPHHEGPRRCPSGPVKGGWQVLGTEEKGR